MKYSQFTGTGEKLFGNVYDGTVLHRIANKQSKNQCSEGVRVGQLIISILWN
jgi:hypothetical protein